MIKLGDMNDHDEDHIPAWTDRGISADAVRKMEAGAAERARILASAELTPDELLLRNQPQSVASVPAQDMLAPAETGNAVMMDAQSSTLTIADVLVPSKTEPVVEQHDDTELDDEPSAVPEDQVGLETIPENLVGSLDRIVIPVPLLTGFELPVGPDGPIFANRAEVTQIYKGLPQSLAAKIMGRARELTQTSMEHLEAMRPGSSEDSRNGEYRNNFGQAWLVALLSTRKGHGVARPIFEDATMDAAYGKVFDVVTAPKQSVNAPPSPGASDDAFRGDQVNTLASSRTTPASDANEAGSRVPAAPGAGEPRIRFEVLDEDAQAAALQTTNAANGIVWNGDDPVEPRGVRPEADKNFADRFPPRPRDWPKMMAWPMQPSYKLMEENNANQTEVDVYMHDIFRRRDAMKARAHKIREYILFNNDPRNTPFHFWDFPGRRRRAADRKGLREVNLDKHFGIKWASLLVENPSPAALTMTARWSFNTATTQDGGILISTNDTFTFGKVSQQSIMLSIHEGQARGWDTFKMQGNDQFVKAAIAAAKHMNVQAEITELYGPMGMLKRVHKVMPSVPGQDPVVEVTDHSPEPGQEPVIDHEGVAAPLPGQSLSGIDHSAIAPQHRAEQFDPETTDLVEAAQADGPLSSLSHLPAVREHLDDTPSDLDWDDGAAQHPSDGPSPDWRDEPTPADWGDQPPAADWGDQVAPDVGREGGMRGPDGETDPRSAVVAPNEREEMKWVQTGAPRFEDESANEYGM